MQVKQGGTYPREHCLKIDSQGSPGYFVTRSDR